MTWKHFGHQTHSQGISFYWADVDCSVMSARVGQTTETILMDATKVHVTDSVNS